MLDEYERSSIKSYGEKLYDAYAYFENMVVREKTVEYDTGASLNDKEKGQLGNFIEKYYFGYDSNGNQEADFNKVGLELKQTPIDKTKKGEYRAGERFSITNISYNEPVEEDFYKSHG